MLHFNEWTFVKFNSITTKLFHDVKIKLLQLWESIGRKYHKKGRMKKPKMKWRRGHCCSTVRAKMTIKYSSKTRKATNLHQLWTCSRAPSCCWGSKAWRCHRRSRRAAASWNCALKGPKLHRCAPRGLPEARSDLSTHINLLTMLFQQQETNSIRKITSNVDVDCTSTM